MIESAEKPVANLHDKTVYDINIRNLKQESNYGLVLIMDWLKTYIDMNTDLRQKAKNNFEKDFFKLMDNAVFGKTMENVRTHRDMKLVTTEDEGII